VNRAGLEPYDIVVYAYQRWEASLAAKEELGGGRFGCIQ
jgi:hypothetical protein